jgi:hypothetical protein
VASQVVGARGMSGWIAISRDIFKHEFFAREPMSEREAWVWMIARAAWEPTRHKAGNDMLDVPRGSFFCTLRELQQAWGWGSDFRVRTFLKRTQAERMIDTKTNAGKTQITICNYDEYQASERTENARKTQAPPQNKRTKETSNKDNKDSEAKASDASVDFAKQLFDRGVVFLSRHGTPDKQARTLIGKWRKAYQDTDIFDAFTACSKEGATDPIPWIAARLGRKGNINGKCDKQQRKLDAFIAGSTGSSPMDSGANLYPALPLLARG